MRMAAHRVGGIQQADNARRLLKSWCLLFEKLRQEVVRCGKEKSTWIRYSVDLKARIEGIQTSDKLFLPDQAGTGG